MARLFCRDAARRASGLIFMLVAVYGVPASAEVTIYNNNVHTSVLATATLYPWAVASDQESSQTVYFSPEPFNDSVSAEVTGNIECFDTATFQLVTRAAFARAVASHDSVFAESYLAASGFAETEVSRYSDDGNDKSCGTGDADAQAQGSYVIDLGDEYSVSLSGELSGEGVVRLIDPTTSPVTVLYDQRSPGPINFSATLEGVYWLYAQASVGTVVMGVIQEERVSAESYFDLSLEFAPPPEVCDNGVDDDRDGLVDDADPDCTPPPPPTAGILVRCLHEPLYPRAGETITIAAEAIDADGNAIEADRIEIYVNNRSQPFTAADGPLSGLEAELTGDRPEFGYGCLAAQGGEEVFSGYRIVDVGEPKVPGWSAIPVFYSERPSHAIDLVFFAEEDAYPAGLLDGQFRSDIYEVVRDGLFEIPWFVRNQHVINIWLARDKAGVRPKDPDDASKKCKKDKPGNFNRKYSFADAAGIIHREECRDNASFKTFSTRYGPKRLQVVAHEIGHAAFSLSDEYEGYTLYFSLPDYPNLLTSENSCRNAAESRGKDPDACRYLDEASGAIILQALWLFEPDFRDVGQPWSGRGDLMQQTGVGACVFNTDTNCGRYRVGASEIDRMNWKVSKCERGRCGSTPN